MVVPVPVPVYIPVPMNMYSQCTPKPMGVPLPVRQTLQSLLVLVLHLIMRITLHPHYRPS